MFYIDPLKEEVMHLKPRIVIFRDLISDHDIAKIRELATPRVSLAKFLLIFIKVIFCREWLVAWHCLAGSTIFADLELT